MVKPSNCSLEGGSFPLSSEFLQVIKKDLWIFLVPVVVGVVQLALFLEEMGFFLRNIQSSRRTCLYLWILGVYPVFCISSIIGMFIPRSSGICNFVASIYHSITLWKFLELITDYFGGKSQMLEVLGNQTVSPNPPPCCCCCCFPNIQVNRSNLRWMNIAVYQLSVVRTLLFFVGLILWTDDKYDYGDATKKALEGYSPRSKFICITLVLVLCGLQNGILETMSALGAIPCVPPWTVETRSQTIYNYSITLEMFFISLFARYCFCRVEPCPESLAQEMVQNKSSQTTLADLYSLPEDEGVRINAAYMSEGDETLCHIEHAPLDKYDFLQENVTVPMRNSRVMSRARSSGLELGNMNLPQARDVSDGAKAPKNRLQVQAQINYIDDATVV
ncbi:organic solute transporter subunit alpha-like isoform X2 [Rana temporaria]|uniref:organic solute transporter subunit alpha-like isoform X2 n=1 Tax=Rana temporaria TaxID=8407 RepID=UPI001AACB5C1|nr:organic solute transporter subunit alpha-like isoform X2 [Rana temporaria]